jgi:hypothetical protein
MSVLMERRSATVVEVELSIVMQMNLEVYSSEEDEDEHKRYIFDLDELDTLRNVAHSRADQLWHVATLAKEFERQGYTYAQLFNINGTLGNYQGPAPSTNKYTADEDLFMYFEQLADLHEFMFMVDEAREGKELGCPFSQSSETMAPLATDG